MSGGIFERDDGGRVNGVLWVEARDNARYPTMHKTASTTKIIIWPQMSNAKIKKFCSR